MFIHQSTEASPAAGILCSEMFLMIAVPYVLARRIALRRIDERRGFEVIQDDRRQQAEQ